MPARAKGFFFQFENTFADAIHIATVHAKYGNIHLEIELRATGSDDDNCKNHHPEKSAEQQTVYVSQEEDRYDFSLNKFDKDYFGFAWFKLPFVCISLPTPPPKILC